MAVSLKKGVGKNTLKTFGFREFMIQASSGLIVAMDTGDISTIREPDAVTQRVIERLIECNLVDADYVEEK